MPINWPAVGAATGTFGMDLFKAKYESDLNQKSAREAAEKNRDIAIEMFGLQKAANLEQWEREKAYNLELWDKQNAYNSPAAQMERLKQAGLNPRLMFSEGNVGNAAPVASASLDTPQLEVPSMETAKYNAPRQGLLQGLQDWFNIKNAGIQNEVLAAEAALKHENANYVHENARMLKRENDNFEKGGGSKYDPPILRPILRYGRDAKKYYEDALLDPMTEFFRVWSQFKGKLKEYGAPTDQRILNIEGGR